MNEGVKIEVELVGFQRAAEVLGRLSAIDMAGLLDHVGETIENQVRLRIGREGPGPEGEQWPRLSSRYEAQKKKHSSGGLLHYSGKLKESLQHNVSDDQLEVGSDQPQAAALQFGYISDSSFFKDIKASFSDIGGGIPARPYLGISDSDQDEIESVIEAWLEKRIAA